jgi:hypothetical protein
MQAGVTEPIVLAGVLALVKAVHALVSLWLASVERRRVLARTLSAGKSRVDVEHRTPDGTLLRVRRGGERR